MTCRHRVPLSILSTSVRMAQPRLDPLYVRFDVAADKMVVDIDGDIIVCSIEKDCPKPTNYWCQFSSSAC